MAAGEAFGAGFVALDFLLAGLAAGVVTGLTGMIFGDGAAWGVLASVFLEAFLFVAGAGGAGGGAARDSAFFRGV